jgi:hypothetical protein
VAQKNDHLRIWFASFFHNNASSKSMLFLHLLLASATAEMFGDPCDSVGVTRHVPAASQILDFCDLQVNADIVDAVRVAVRDMTLDDVIKECAWGDCFGMGTSSTPFARVAARRVRTAIVPFDKEPAKQPLSDLKKRQLRSLVHETVDDLEVFMGKTCAFLTTTTPDVRVSWFKAAKKQWYGTYCTF